MHKDRSRRLLSVLLLNIQKIEVKARQKRHFLIAEVTKKTFFDRRSDKKKSFDCRSDFEENLRTRLRQIANEMNHTRVLISSGFKYEPNNYNC